MKQTYAAANVASSASSTSSAASNVDAANPKKSLRVSFSLLAPQNPTQGASLSTPVSTTPQPKSPSGPHR